MFAAALPDRMEAAIDTTYAPRPSRFSEESLNGSASIGSTANPHKPSDLDPDSRFGPR